MRKNLAAFYFSGTGNTRVVTERLCALLEQAYTVRICDITRCDDPESILADADTVLFAFPVYGSAPPWPMRNFVWTHKASLAGKEGIVAATQYMFSGDGAASLRRTVQSFGCRVRFAEHVCMPNNISDCRIFAVRNGDELAPLLQKANARIEKFAARILANKPFLRGCDPFSHAVGYCSQRALFRRHEAEKRAALRIHEPCIGCGACVRHCPVGNLMLRDGKAVPRGNCALCYRCVNLCPQKAITLVGKKPPVVQYKGVPKECFSGK